MFIFVKTIDKELNRIKDFLKKKQFFLYWTPNRYQSKTCVEHIEQVIDKSLINSTNSSMNLLYFLHMRVICFKYCKKVYEKSNQENLNFFGRIYGYVMFNFSISVIVFKYMQGYCNALDILYVFSLNLSLKLSFLIKSTFPKFYDSFNESHFQEKTTAFYYWFYWF